MRENTARHDERIKALEEARDNEIPELKKRIRKLENWRNILAGAMSAGTVGTAGGLAWLKNLLIGS